MKKYAMTTGKRLVLAGVAATVASLSSSCVFAARQIYQQVAQAREHPQLLDEGDAGTLAVADLPAGTRVVRDVAYGSDPRQRIDVYVPPRARGAAVVVMVHGGGWAFGDKRMARVVTNKARHWLDEGLVFVSVDNRLLPTPPEEQARDVAAAVAAVQRHAPEWGADPNRLVLMGHSAGAHLVALLTASPALASAAGVRPWRGSVLLDSAAFDVGATMRGRHFPLYDRAFGNDPARWDALSPLQRLDAAPVPLLAVCSSRRLESCPQAQAFVDKARALGGRADVLREDLTHAQINATLGLPGGYTGAVDAFLRAVGALAPR